MTPKEEAIRYLQDNYIYVGMKFKRAIDIAIKRTREETKKEYQSKIKELEERLRISIEYTIGLEKDFEKVINQKTGDKDE